MRTFARSLVLGCALLLAGCGAPAAGGASLPGQIAFVSDRTGSRQIFVVRPDRSGLTQITRGPYHVAPAWSPDSAKLAFISDRADATWQLYTMNADGSGEQRLGRHAPASDGNPAWSPDGSAIAFDLFYANSFDLEVMLADGSDLVSLTQDAQADTHPSWSPDGTQIAFQSERAGRTDDIFVMRADGSGITNLTRNPAHDTTPAWSPDGSAIAFASDRSGNTDIFVMRADGADPLNLTNDPADDGSPAWSPDGQWIAFVSNRAGNFDIFVMRADGSQVYNLTSNPALDSEPAWGR